MRRLTYDQSPPLATTELRSACSKCDPVSLHSTNRALNSFAIRKEQFTNAEPVCSERFSRAAVKSQVSKMQRSVRDSRRSTPWKRQRTKRVVCQSASNKSRRRTTDPRTERRLAPAWAPFRVSTSAHVLGDALGESAL